MKNRAKLMSDYFQNVSKEELIQDIHKSGMFNNKRASITVHDETGVQIHSVSGKNFSPGPGRGRRVRGAVSIGRKRNTQKKMFHN